MRVLINNFQFDVKSIDEHTDQTTINISTHEAGLCDFLNRFVGMQGLVKIITDEGERYKRLSFDYQTARFEDFYDQESDTIKFTFHHNKKDVTYFSI